MGKLSTSYICLPAIYDLHQQVIAELHFYPGEQLLHLMWRGNLTAYEVVRVAQMSVPLQQNFPFTMVLNDKTESTGDWSEALPYLEFEWLPQALQGGLRAFAYVFSPELHNQFISVAFVERLILRNLPVQMFYDVDTAWNWLQQQAVHA